MGLQAGTQPIGQWTVSTLTKFLDDYFRQHPLPTVERLSVDFLTVQDLLTVADRSDFKAVDVHAIGTQGNPAFTNGWGNYGAPYSNAGYVKDPTGWVRLTGVIKSGTLGSSAFTLAPGYRPAVAPGPFAVISNGALGRVDIGTDGTVTPQSPASNASVSLEGIVFKAG